MSSRAEGASHASRGRPASRNTYKKAVRRPVVFDTEMPECPAAPSSADWQRTSPARAPASMADTCPAVPPTNTTSRTAARAMPARCWSGHRLRAMPSTAWATTATAATFRPWIMPWLTGPSSRLALRAKATRMIAEGRVKAVQAAAAPQPPPRCRPMAKPTWLLAGPGRNWHRATRSA